MPEPKLAAATTDHVKGKDINGQMVILERTQPRQLSLFQTFLSDEERYSNTIDLYDALPKYFSNHTIMRSLRKSGLYLGCLNRPSAVDRFLDFSCQSRFSHVRWPNIFNYTRGLLGHQMRPMLIFTTR